MLVPVSVQEGESHGLCFGRSSSVFLLPVWACTLLDTLFGLLFYPRYVVVGTVVKTVHDTTLAAALAIK